MNKGVLLAVLLAGCSQQQVKHPELSLGEKSAYLEKTWKDEEHVVVSGHGLTFSTYGSHKIEITKTGEFFADFIWIYNQPPYDVFEPKERWHNGDDSFLVCYPAQCESLNSNPDVTNLFNAAMNSAYNKSTCKEYSLPPSVANSFEKLIKKYKR